MGRSSSSDSISHSGVITGITPELTSVRIISESACASCHAASLCMMSEVRDKVIEVPTSPYQDYAVGQEVDVMLKASMGHKAVWLAYVIPLVVMVASLMLPLHFGAGELVSGLICIAAVALYYLLIWLLRGTLRDSYVFTIRDKQNNNYKQ